MKKILPIVLSLLTGLGLGGYLFIAQPALANCVGTDNFPTALTNFSALSCITSKWLNSIETLIGITNSSVPTTLTWQINHLNLTSNASGTLPVAHGGTGASSLTLGGFLQGNGTSSITVLSPTVTGQFPIASGTSWITGTFVSGNNITITTSTTGQVTVTSLGKFGGTGTDGVLNLNNGTSTTINLSTSSVVSLNYSSITISSTSSLAFKQPSPTGTIIMIFSQGDCNIAGTIYATSTGANGGMGGVTGSNNDPGINGSSSIDVYVSHGGTGGSTTGKGGGGGANSVNGGSNSVDGTLGGLVYADGAKYRNQLYKAIFVAPGSGAGGGATGTNNGSTAGGGGAGGRGGGGLYIECGGAWNFTGTITTAGINGVTGVDGSGVNAGGGGGGGGGGAGDVLVLYKTLTADSGTYTLSGGSGGNGGNPGSGGATGQGGGAGASSTATRQANITF